MICVPATLTSASLTHDKGIRLGFHTQEITKEAREAVLDLHDAFGWLVFKENEISDEDVPDVDAEEKKTLAQRIRDRYYVLHGALGGKKEDFNAFYRARQEKRLEEISEEIRAAEESERLA